MVKNQEERLVASAEQIAKAVYDPEVLDRQLRVGSLVAKMEYPGQATAVAILQLVSEIPTYDAANGFQSLPLIVRTGVLVASASNLSREHNHHDPNFRNWPPLAHVALYSQLACQELGSEAIDGLPPFNTQAQLNFLLAKHDAGDALNELASGLPSHSVVRNSL